MWRLDFAGLSEDRAGTPDEYDEFVSIAISMSKFDGGGRLAANAIAKALASDWGIQLTESEVGKAAEAIESTLEWH